MSLCALRPFTFTFTTFHPSTLDLVLYRSTGFHVDMRHISKTGSA